MDLARSLYRGVRPPSEPGDVDLELSRRVLGPPAEASPLGVPEAFGQWEIAAERFTEVNENVVVTVRVRARGQVSGVVIEGRHFTVLTFRGGELVASRQFWSEADAFDALGLDESDSRMASWEDDGARARWRIGERITSETSTPPGPRVDSAFDRLADDVLQAIVVAQREARASGATVTDTDHLLLGLVEHASEELSSKLASLGLTADRLRRRVPRHGRVDTGGTLPFSQAARDALAGAIRGSSGDADLGTNELLLALLEQRATAALELLAALDLSPAQVRIALPQATAEDP
jgi:hypothetical protein